MKLQTLFAGCTLFAASCNTGKTCNITAKSGTQTGETTKLPKTKMR